MKYIRSAALALSTLFVVVLTGCSLFPNEEEPLEPPLVAPSSVNYKTVAVERGSIY